MTFIASNGVSVSRYKPEEFKGVYYEANGWVLSPYHAEDGDIERAKLAVGAWQAWVEFLESGGPSVGK